MLTDELETVPCLCGAADGAQPLMTAENFNTDCGPQVSFQVVRCGGCGLQYTNPRPVTSYLAQFYPQQYYAYQPKGVKVRTGLKALGARIEDWTRLAVRQAFWGYPVSGPLHRWLLRLLVWPLALRMRLLGKDLKIVPYRGQGRLLDVGCGSGSDLLYQRQFGLTVAGVELNASAAERARIDHGLDVRAGTMEEAGFAQGAFDIIHMSHVFEHLPDPAAALKTMRHLLDTGGLIILKVPNADSFSAKRYGPHWLGLDVPRHLYHFTPKTITTLLQRHGFTVTAIRPDPGMWSMWRESERFELRAQGKPEPGDSKRRGFLHQSLEWWACLTGRGSAIAVYATKGGAPR